MPAGPKPTAATSEPHEVGTFPQHPGIVKPSTSTIPEFLAGSHRPLSSSFWEVPCRILNIDHNKELLRGLWVARPREFPTLTTLDFNSDMEVSENRGPYL